VGLITVCLERIFTKTFGLAWSAHPAFQYSVATGGWVSTGIERPGLEVYNIILFRVKFKNVFKCTSTPLYALAVGRGTF
jgi:hypothetical protein